MDASGGTNDNITASDFHVKIVCRFCVLWITEHFAIDKS